MKNDAKKITLTIALALVAPLAVGMQQGPCRYDLPFAVNSNNEAHVRRALAEGADVNAAANYKRLTPLHLAAHRGHANIINLLLDAGAEIERCTRAGQSPLHLATAEAHEHATKALLARNANVDAHDAFDKRTPLHYAVGNQTGFAACAACVLLEADADLEARDGYNRMPLMYAMAQRYVRSHTIRALLEAGTQMEESEAHGFCGR